MGAIVKKVVVALLPEPFIHVP